MRRRSLKKGTFLLQIIPRPDYWTAIITPLLGGIQSTSTSKADPFQTLEMTRLVNQVNPCSFILILPKYLYNVYYLGSICMRISGISVEIKEGC